MTAAYPYSPGTKRPGTSSLAGDEIAESAAALRLRCVAFVRQHGAATPEEAQIALGLPNKVDPRFTEAKKQVPPQLVETGERRRNRSGKFAMVVRCTTDDEKRAALAQLADTISAYHAATQQTGETA